MKLKLLTPIHHIRWYGQMFFFLFILFSCSSELLQSEQEYSRITSENLLRQLRYVEFKNEVPHLFEKLKFKSLKKNNKVAENSKTFLINNFKIDAEYVYISEHETGKKTYTFYSENNDKSAYLENYVVNEQDNGVFDAYL